MSQPQPIRIMRIIARLNVGGPAIHVALLTEKLGAPTYASTLVCGTVGADEGDMQYYAEAHDVQPVIIPELGRSLNPLRDLVTIWKVYQADPRVPDRTWCTRTPPKPDSSGGSPRGWRASR